MFSGINLSEATEKDYVVFFFIIFFLFFFYVNAFPVEAIFFLIYM